MPGAGDPVPMLKRDGDPGACCGVDGLGGRDVGAGAGAPNANGELGAVVLVLAGAGAGAPNPNGAAPFDGALPPPNENAGD